MPFSSPPTFRADIERFQEKIKNRENFAFSKYADGELHILANQKINNGEFWFNPETDQFYRQKLVESFTHNEDGYYMGISCPCCIGGTQAHEFMKRTSNKTEDKLTWANLFVNSNYDFYLEKIVPLYAEYEVNLVSNDESNLDSLPFIVSRHFKIGKNAWNNDYGLVEDIKNFILENKIKNNLFLFCAGPFGNILAAQLHKVNKENTYIDIGSTLNPFLLGEKGKNRGYLRVEPGTGKPCTWS